MNGEHPNTREALSTEERVPVLPCPFCGAQPEWHEAGPGDNHWFGCMTEKCVGPYVTDMDREYIFKVWNTRAP